MFNKWIHWDTFKSGIQTVKYIFVQYDSWLSLPSRCNLGCKSVWLLLHVGKWLLYVRKTTRVNLNKESGGKSVNFLWWINLEVLNNRHYQVHRLGIHVVAANWTQIWGRYSRSLQKLKLARHSWIFICTFAEKSSFVNFCKLNFTGIWLS